MLLLISRELHGLRRVAADVGGRWVILLLTALRRMRDDISLDQTGRGGVEQRLG